MPRLITRIVVADFRNRLCDVAGEMFTALGRDGFNMRELAKRLHVSPMTAYRYFRDKEEILAVLRARAFGRFAECIAATHTVEGGALARNIALATAYVQFVREEESNYRLMFDLFQPHLPAVPELAVEERRARAAITEHVRLMVRDGACEGEPQMIGEVLWSAMHGAASLCLAGKLPAAELDRMIPEAVRMVAAAYQGGNAHAAAAWQMPPRSNGTVYSGMPAE